METKLSNMIVDRGIKAMLLGRRVGLLMRMERRFLKCGKQ